MKRLLLLTMVAALPTQVFAWNHWQNKQAEATASANQTQSQQQSASSNSNSWSNANQSQNAYGGAGGQGGAGGDGGDARSSAHASGGDAYAQGGKSLAGAVSGSNSGGNSQDTNINVEGDEVAAASAIAGQAGECVTVLAAQATGGGFSLGGIDGDCRAAMAADRNWTQYFTLDELAGTVDNPDTRDMLLDKRDEALELALEYTELANPSAFKIYMSGVRQTTTDIVLSFGWLALFAL